MGLEMEVGGATATDDTQVDATAEPLDGSTETIEPDMEPMMDVAGEVAMYARRDRSIRIQITTDLTELDPAFVVGAIVDACINPNGVVYVIDESEGLPMELERGEYMTLNDDGNDGSQKEENSARVETVDVRKACERGECLAGPVATTVGHAATTAHEQRISDLASKIASAAVNHARLKAAVKDAANEFADLVDRLDAIMEDGPEEMPLFDRQPKQGAAGTPTDPQPDPDDAWRSEPLESILGDVKGLGKAKRESLLDAIPTLGKFENMRAEAAREYLQLKDLMPKGIGQGICDQLEEAALNWLSRNLNAEAEAESDEQGEQEEGQGEDRQEAADDAAADLDDI